LAAEAAAVSIVALLLVLRFVPAQPAVAAGSLLGELRVFAGRDVQLAIALTAMGNVGVVTVFTYIAPLLTDVSGVHRRRGAGVAVGLRRWRGHRELPRRVARGCRTKP
jgi:predicted MFS family arabinose efflux permease